MTGTVAKVGLLALVSLLIIAGVVSLVGWQDTAEALWSAGPLFLPVAGAMTLALLLLQTGGWAMLNRAVDHRVKFRTLCEAGAVGTATGLVTPSAYLGGEPVKVIYVGRKTGLPYQELAGTVVLAKYIEGMSFVLSFGVCTIIAAVYYRDVLFSPVNLPLGVTLLVLAAALLGLALVLWLSLSRGWSPLARLVGLVGRLHVGSKFFKNLRERTHGMEQQVSRVFCEEGETAWKAFGFFFSTHVLVFVKPGILFYIAWGEYLGLGELSLIFVACQALLAFQFTPSGAGTLDGGMLGTFALLGAGISDSQCMAWLLCLRFWDCAMIAVGALLAAHVGTGILRGDPRPKPRTDAPEDAA